MRRSCLAVFAAAFTLLAAGAAMAQDGFPNKGLRFVVPFSAGGGTDVVARIVAKGLAERLGQSIVVENRTGAGVTIGSDYVAKSPPDGYTLLYTSVGHAMAPSLYARLPYTQDDLVAVAIAGSAPLILTLHPSVPATDLKSLIALFKANPGKYSYGSSGNGTTLHMAGELFKSLAGVDVVHVPYRGAAPAMNDLLSGQIAYVFDQISTAAGFITTGKLRGIAVTMPTRSPMMPDIPTMVEAGLPGYEAYTWNAVLAPRGTPAPIIDKLNREINAVLETAETKKRFIELGVDVPSLTTPQTAAAFIAAETRKWEPIVKASGALVQ